MDQSDYTLPGIMNYLQSEFTQIEKMKIANNLEINEMKFKIAKLEGVKNALTTTNSKLVENVASLKNDTKYLLKVIHDLKKENKELKAKLNSDNKANDTNKEPVNVDEPTDESSDIDNELKELIDKLSSIKNSSLFVKEIKELDLKTGTDTITGDYSDNISSIDLAPLITSRKFLQDCMKEMFYLIRNGHGNIVNNISEFNFDNGDNQGMDSKNSLGETVQETGNFEVFEKYNYLTAEQQNDFQIKKEISFEENQLIEQRHKKEQTNKLRAMKSQIENANNNNNRGTNANAPSGALDFDGKLMNYNNQIETKDIEESESTSDNINGTQNNKFTLLLRSPEVFLKKESETEAPQAEEDNFDNEGEEELEEEELGKAKDDYYQDSDAETIVDVTEIDYTDKKVKLFDTDKDIIINSEIEEEEMKMEDIGLEKLKGKVSVLELNNDTDETLVVCKQKLYLMKKSEDTNELTIVHDKVLSLKGNSIVKWFNEDQFLLNSGKEPYTINVYNKSTFESIAKIDILQELKIMNNKDEADPDNEDDENIGLLPLRDSTILNLDLKDEKLLVTCSKFMYVYNLKDLKDIKSIYYEKVSDQNNFQMIKCGKFLGSGSVFLLSHTGVSKKVNFSKKDTKKVSVFFTIKSDLKEFEHSTITAFDVIDDSCVLMLFKAESNDAILFQSFDTEEGSVSNNVKLVLRLNNIQISRFEIFKHKQSLHGLVGTGKETLVLNFDNKKLLYKLESVKDKIDWFGKLFIYGDGIRSIALN